MQSLDGIHSTYQANSANLNSFLELKKAQRVHELQGEDIRQTALYDRKVMLDNYKERAEFDRDMIARHKNEL